ncbi:MAG: flagellar hook basal-body protein [Bacilli bacterium]
MIIGQATQRVEASAQNVANASTAGYKRRVPFEAALEAGGPNSGVRSSAALTYDFAPGKLVETSNPYDLAILREGFFVTRDDDRPVYTRQGQFQRTADGRLATSAGQVLQSDAGRDLVIESSDFTVDPQGVVLVGGEPVDRIAVATFEDLGQLAPAESEGFLAAEGTARPSAHAAIRQGAFEASNVASGEEMVAMMEALRRAETGQRLVQVYDDLMARAITQFGQTP